MKASQERLYNDVEFLTTISPPRNYQNKASLNKASQYIYDELQKTSPSSLQYQVYTAKGEQYKNITAYFKGQSSQRIIVGAHYDVCGDTPGADDNASAVAGLLETARLIAQLQPKLKYSVELVGYCLEEPPFFNTNQMGSAVHAAAIHELKLPVKLMICYEMIGYFSDEPNSQNFPSPLMKPFFPDKGNFIIVGGKFSQLKTVNKVSKLMKKHSNIDVKAVAVPMAEDLLGLSDHRNYWKYGYPAVMINDTSFMRNPHYHELTDTIDTLNFEKMAEVVNGVYGVITNY